MWRCVIVCWSVDVIGKTFRCAEHTHQTVMTPSILLCVCVRGLESPNAIKIELIVTDWWPNKIPKWHFAYGGGVWLKARRAVYCRRLAIKTRPPVAINWTVHNIYMYMEQLNGKKCSVIGELQRSGQGQKARCFIFAGVDWNESCDGDRIASRNYKILQNRMKSETLLRVFDKAYFQQMLWNKSLRSMISFQKIFH